MGFENRVFDYSLTSLVSVFGYMSAHYVFGKTRKTEWQNIRVDDMRMSKDLRGIYCKTLQWLMCAACQKRKNFIDEYLEKV